MSNVVVYSSMFCGFCARAKKLLKAKGVDFQEIDVMTEPQRRQEMIQKAGGRTSVPQIFIGDRHVGGCQELFALEDAGKLDPLLAEAS